MFRLKKPLDTAEIYFSVQSVQNICIQIFTDFYLYPTTSHVHTSPKTNAQAQ